MNFGGMNGKDGVATRRTPAQRAAQDEAEAVHVGWCYRVPGLPGWSGICDMVDADVGKARFVRGRHAVIADLDELVLDSDGYVAAMNTLK